jgi:hypothetical protein
VCRSPQASLALACSIQAVANGLLGLCSWCARDVRFFVCRALFVLTPFAWAGYLVGVTEHLCLRDVLLSFYDDVDDEGFQEELRKSDIDLLHTYIRLGLGCFMVFMSLWVLIGVCLGGVNRYCCPSRTGGSTPGCKSFCQWIIAVCCSFNTGYIFVANVGSGMGITTFFVLSMFLGVETKRALPTSIVISGWTAIAPAAVNWLVLDGHAYVRLLLTFPGLWAGTLLAPWFSKAGGPMCDLAFYFVVLAACGSAVVVMAAASLSAGHEDVDLAFNPVVSISALNLLFEGPAAAAPTKAPTSLPEALVGAAVAAVKGKHSGID